MSGDRDWGGDTQARFRYQSEVALPFCLSVMLGGGGIDAVVMEHREDIALKVEGGWRFLQVKSRNPERPLWTLATLLEKKGGALRSLYRTYLLTRREGYSLELALEGATKTNDPIRALVAGADRSAAISQVAEKLCGSKAQAADFLRRLTLNESPPHRTQIKATNLALLHEYARGLHQPELTALHSALIASIEDASMAVPMGPMWPRALVHPEERATDVAATLKVKTLDAARLAPLGAALTSEIRPLLKRYTARGSRPISRLEQKMIRGGAPQGLIDRAISLMANARFHRETRLASSLEQNDSVVEDLHERLLTHAETARAVHSGSTLPAVGIWEVLFRDLNASPAGVDRSNLLRADPMLLLGEACSLSDMCEFGWGESSE